MIVIDRTEREERGKITSLLKRHDCRWWHWMNSMWLVADRDEHSAATLWLRRIKPLIKEGTRIFITEVEVLDWVAVIPDGAETWLTKNWGAGSE
jgi:hypothetical protein